VDPTLALVYSRARGKVTADEFLARVEKARAEFDGLLDDEALGLLVLDELGLNDGAFLTIAELSGRAEASVRDLTVERVEPPREFQREGRAPGRVANVVVRDATGEARVTLWDRDVEKAEDGTLAPGKRLTLVNARVKDSRYGLELHVTPWTAIEVEGQLDPAKRKLLLDVQPEADPLAVALKDDAVSPQTRLEAPGPLRGALVWIGPTRPFRRADGTTGFACDIDVDTPDGRIRVVCWDEAVKAARALALDAPVIIEPLVARSRGAALEWHTTRDTKFRVA
jgi:replication factor A1